MHKLLTSLILFTVLLFLIAALYVFETWPFNPGGPLFPETGSSQEITAELPELFSDKIERVKSYDEYMGRGKLLEEKGYLTLAIAEFEAAAKSAPEKAEPLIQIGRMHIKENDYLKAKISFEQALKIKPNDTAIKVYLARTLLSMRKQDEARKILSSVQNPSQESKYYQAIVEIYFGDYEKAKKYLNDSLAIGGSNDITQKTKNFLAAFDEFNFSKGGQQSHLKTLLARSYNQTGEYETAIPLLFQVIKEKKDYRDAWIMLGYAYLNIEKYEEAIEALQEAKKLDAQKPETLFFLGLAYYGVNDLKKAAENLELSKKNGFEPKVQINQKLAEIYLQMKSYKEAADNYETVLALNNQDINYFIKPVWIYLERLNQPVKAVALAQKAMFTHPNEAMSFNLLGWSKIGENRLDEAEDLLKKALEMDPQLAAAYLNFGYLYEKRAQLDLAINSYKKAYSMGNGTSISSAAADRYNQLVTKISNTAGAAENFKASLLSIP